MKSIPTDLRTHLDHDVTALCTCWVITRSDGVVLRFTDADVDVEQDGYLYKSIGAYRRTAIENTSSLAVDNLDIVGSAADLALPEEELRAGLFDNAEIMVFMTPWLGSVRGKLKLRRGFFGEVQVLPNGTYQVELRGLMQRLSYNYTDIFSSTCLYDLGEPACGINIKGKDMNVGTVFSVGDGARIAQSAYVRGKFYDIGWRDPDFEEAGALGGVAASPYWANVGPSDLVVVTDEKYSGTYAVRGGAGNGSIMQEVDLEADTGLPERDIASEACYATVRAFRRDNADEGRFTVSFLDRDGAELGYGQQLDVAANAYTLNSLLTLSGDFTVELWVKPETSASIHQAIFTQGTFGGIGATGNRLTYENGTLSFRVDDDVLAGTAQIVVASSQPPTQDEWQHIALVRSGTNILIYENFVLTGSGTFSGDVKIKTFGNGPDSSGFVGKWDELRVWGSAKSAFDLALDARRTISATSSGLLLYYSFNDVNGADLTGNDTLQFGSSALVRASGSPVAVAAADALALGTATYTTGFQNVGTAWIEVGMQDHLIPANARQMRIQFDVNSLGSIPVDARIDNLTGHVINKNEFGPIIGYMTNDVAWKCTAAGTANADTGTGGVGSTIVAGATFVGENAWMRGARVLSVIDNRTFICEVNDARAVDAWFNGGTALFETGANAGAGMEIKSWDATTRKIELFLSMPNQIKAGDYLSLYPGCDKSRISCAAIFNNTKNMFATPDVPGQDELFRYPDAK